ncbi:hypothetical protein [Robiginitalea aurantiaca]|uniref:Uncharacterized protein n=1 Tax=Robiginitalea aurantiaca TaxID=3056915 RepID=A0ABT7WIR9_9FLAO|nr:hypothetical protein [Robiginitalea aurantiaca]MDM9632812.1 hypothetical protein [Robiginitalea aurantiaca]
MGIFSILAFMDPAEYLAIIPLLIYGIGLTDLLSEWKRMFDKDDRNLLYIIYTIILTEVAVYNVVIYVDLVNTFPHQTYAQYLGYLLPPILFMIVVNVFTPNPGSKTAEYFNDNISLIFILMAIFIASHYFYSFEEPNRVMLQRGGFILLFLLTAYFKKKWMMYLISVLWLVGLVFKGGMMVG